MGLPLVDADGMGRAFPEMQMVTPTIYGISATPMALADEKGKRGDHRDDRQPVDGAVRALAHGRHGLHGHDRALRHGRPDAEGGDGTGHDRARGGTRPAGPRDPRRARRPIGAVLERLNGFRVFTGKVADVERRTETGFARGEAQIEGGGQEAGSTLELRFQNEHLVALRDGEIVATVPDLIIVLDAETGEPITTEELRYGFRVTVIATPCDRRWRTPAGIELAGPRYFGYDVDYVPIEERFGA